MSQASDSATNWLANHPKMTGVLFTALLALSNAGSAAASFGATTAGP